MLEAEIRKQICRSFHAATELAIFFPAMHSHIHTDILIRLSLYLISFVLAAIEVLKLLLAFDIYSNSN